MKNITREEFLELSALLFTSQSHNLDNIIFEGKSISNDFAQVLLDSYREAGLQITETGKIPDRIANQIKC